MTSTRIAIELALVLEDEDEENSTLGLSCVRRISGIGFSPWFLKSSNGSRFIQAQTISDGKKIINSTVVLIFKCANKMQRPIKKFRGKQQKGSVKEPKCLTTMKLRKSLVRSVTRQTTSNYIELFGSSTRACISQNSKE